MAPFKDYFDAFLYAICYHGPEVSRGIFRGTIGRCADKSARRTDRMQKTGAQTKDCLKVRSYASSRYPVISTLRNSGQVYSVRLIFFNCIPRPRARVRAEESSPAVEVGKNCTIGFRSANVS